MATRVVARCTSGSILVLALLAAGGCSEREAIGADAAVDGAGSGDLTADLALDLTADLALDQTADLALDQSSAPDLSLPDGPAVDWPPPAPGWNSGQALTGDMHGAACVGGHVYLVGAAGAIFHRAPGAAPGAGFIKQSAPITTDLYTVSFADLTYGVVAGKHPQIWETKDKGATWSIAPQCSAFVFETFHALHLHAANQGFGAGIAVNNQGGGYKYYSGSSWVCPYETYPGEAFLDVFRLGQQGWIVGQTGGKVYRTEDGGMSWTAVAAGTTATLRALHFTSGTSGVAVGDQGTIVRTTDGKTFQAVTSPTSQTLHDVFFWDASTGWAVGEAGTVIHTADGGQSWVAQPSGTSNRLEGVCFTSATAGWATGASGTVLFTVTGGI